MQNIIKTTLTDLRVELANLESFLMSQDLGYRSEVLDLLEDWVSLCLCPHLQLS